MMMTQSVQAEFCGVRANFRVRGRAGVRAAFTLIELLIVITGLAIIAGVVIPELDSAVADARYSAMLHTLNEMSLGIERYRIDHGGRPPALQGGSLPQLLTTTDSRGTIGTGPAYRYGPYLPSPFPVNPLNQSRVVSRTMVAPPLNLENRVGWIYHAGTGQIWAGLYEGVADGKTLDAGGAILGP
jgi:type II secretory pathway pseudopilin PulG